MMDSTSYCFAFQITFPDPSTRLQAMKWVEELRKRKWSVVKLEQGYETEVSNYALGNLDDTPYGETKLELEAVDQEIDLDNLKRFLRDLRNRYKLLCPIVVDYSVTHYDDHNGFRFGGGAFSVLPLRKHQKEAEQAVQG
jgi:hypothetical protein